MTESKINETPKRLRMPFIEIAHVVTESSINETPRHMRTPLTEAIHVMVSLENSYADFIGTLIPADNPETYPNNILDVYADMLGNEDAATGGSLIELKSCPFMVSTAYAVQALKAYKQFSENKDSDSNNLTWTFIADAKFWLGTALDITVTRVREAEKKRDIAENGEITSRHYIDRMVKKAVFMLYEANIDTFQSKDEAAEIIALQINRKFRRVRGYITDYHREKNTAS